MTSIDQIIRGLSVPLKIEQVDWRVQSVKETKKGVGMIVLGYKDARVDMQRLDEVTRGAWQTMYQRDSKGVLQCGIGIYCQMSDDNFQWVWKYSNGVESFSEASKGEYSDSFKRAGFMWGIGRELYDLPFIWVNLNEGEYYEKNGKITNSLNPNNLIWKKENELLRAFDKSGAVRFQEYPKQSTQGKTNDSKPTLAPAKDGGKQPLDETTYNAMVKALEDNRKANLNRVKKALNEKYVVENKDWDEKLRGLIAGEK